MASFCSNCGAALGVNGVFCGKCGARAGGGAQAAAVPKTAAMPASGMPAASSGGGSTALKIVLVLLCVLVLGGMAVAGGVYYLAHRAKQMIVQKAAEQGVDLNSLASSSAGESSRHLPKPCDVLSKEQVSGLIGEPIERAEERDAMCQYFGPAGLSARLAQEGASGTFHRAQAPGAAVGGTEVANSVDQLVNSLAAQNGQTGSGGEMPLLMLAIMPDGKPQMTAVSATKAIFGSMGKAADGSGGLAFGADIPGLGDKAVRVPKLGLNVLEGDTLIRIIPGPFPDADSRTIAVARAVLPKI